MGLDTKRIKYAALFYRDLQINSVPTKHKRSLREKWVTAVAKKIL